jgi:uncharacterized membrane protein YcjF (UPF0283 family)
MNSETKRGGLYFALELLIYGVLVVGYLFAVTHFLGDWIEQIYEKSNRLYALLALMLIIVQGLVLDIVTRTVLNSIHPRWK